MSQDLVLRGHHNPERLYHYIRALTEDRARGEHDAMEFVAQGKIPTFDYDKWLEKELEKL